MGRKVKYRDREKHGMTWLMPIRFRVVRQVHRSSYTVQCTSYSIVAASLARWTGIIISIIIDPSRRIPTIVRLCLHRRLLECIEGESPLRVRRDQSSDQSKLNTSV